MAVSLECPRSYQTRHASKPSSPPFHLGITVQSLSGEGAHFSFSDMNSRLLLLATAVICCSATVVADDCATLPRPRMRVRLTVTAEHAAVVDIIKAVVSETWQAEGLTLEWADPTEGTAQWDDIDVWIAAVRRPRPSGQSGHRHILGEVSFRQGAPGRLIRIHIDAVLAWLQQDQSAVARRVARILGPSLAITQALSRALGQVAAHEFGHYVLGSAEHAATGLMQARYRQPSRFLSMPAPLALDVVSRTRLARRLAARAACP